MQVAPATSAAVVQVTGVVKEFGTLRVLDGVSLDVARGQTVADRKSTRLNSSHMPKSRMPSSA